MSFFFIAPYKLQEYTTVQTKNLLFIFVRIMLRQEEWLDVVKLIFYFLLYVPLL